MIQLSTQELVTRIRNRINDKTGRIYDTAEILEVADDAVREVFTTLRLHSDDHGLDSLDFATATDLTRIDDRTFQWSPPEGVADIQMLEFADSTGRPVQLRKLSLEEKDYAGFASYPIADAYGWYWGPRRTVRICGQALAFPTLRCWFIRALPPMFTALGAIPSSAETFIPVQSSPGLVNRSGLYVGSQFEVMSGNINDLRKIVTCTVFDVSGAMTTITFTPAVAAVTDTSTTLSMLLPVPAEYSAYIAVRAARTLFMRQGSDSEIKMIREEFLELKDDFEAGVARRSSGEPPRLFSSREL